MGGAGGAGGAGDGGDVCLGAPGENVRVQALTAVDFAVLSDDADTDGRLRVNTARHRVYDIRFEFVVRARRRIIAPKSASTGPLAVTSA